MIEMTIAAHDAAEIQVIADALQRIAALRQESAQTAQITLPFPPEAASALAQTATVTVVDPAPAEAPKRRGRPPKAKPDEQAQADEAAVEAAEERAAIQAEATLTVTEPESDDDIPLEPAAPAAAPAPALTLEAVRATLAAASQAGKAAGVKAALASLGAAKLTDVSPANYSALLEKVGAL